MPSITGVSHIDLTVTDLERSAGWYTDLFGLSRILEGRNDDHHFASCYLLHPDSLLIIGLVQHDGDGAGRFDERRTGLDHLSFNVATRDELDEWQQRLAERAVEHSPIAEGEMWDVLVARDPDGIQLEFFVTKPAAAALLTG